MVRLQEKVLCVCVMEGGHWSSQRAAYRAVLVRGRSRLREGNRRTVGGRELEINCSACPPLVKKASKRVSPTFKNKNFNTYACMHTAAYCSGAWFFTKKGTIALK